MLRVQQLFRFLSDLNPQNTPVRLSLFNYLKSRTNPEEIIDAELFENYFCHCLEYPHWHSNKAQLGREVLFILQNFNSFYAHSQLNLETIKFPQETQVVEIENQKDLADAVSQYIETLCGNFDRYRVVADHNKKILALIVRANQNCEIHQLDRKFTIRNGRLEPLRKDLVLYYDANLKLSPFKNQRIELAPYLIAHFSITLERKIMGSLLRGYVFQNLAEFRDLPFYQCSKVLEGVKKQESFFFEKGKGSEDDRAETLIAAILPETAPEAPMVLTMPPPPVAEGTREVSGGDQRYLENLLNKAENALENIFSGDKQLSTLVDKFRKYLSDKESPQAELSHLKKKEGHLWTTEEKTHLAAPTINPTQDLDLKDRQNLDPKDR